MVSLAKQDGENLPPGTSLKIDVGRFEKKDLQNLFSRMVEMEDYAQAAIVLPHMKSAYLDSALIKQLFRDMNSNANAHGLLLAVIETNSYTAHTPQMYPQRIPCDIALACLKRNWPTMAMFIANAFMHNDADRLRLYKNEYKNEYRRMGHAPIRCVDVVSSFEIDERNMPIIKPETAIALYQLISDGHAWINYAICCERQLPAADALFNQWCKDDPAGIYRSTRLQMWIAHDNVEELIAVHQIPEYKASWFYCDMLWFASLHNSINCIQFLLKQIGDSHMHHDYMHEAIISAFWRAIRSVHKNPATILWKRMTACYTCMECFRNRNYHLGIDNDTRPLKLLQTILSEQERIKIRTKGRKKSRSVSVRIALDPSLISDMWMTQPNNLRYVYEMYGTKIKKCNARPKIFAYHHTKQCLEQYLIPQLSAIVLGCLTW